MVILIFTKATRNTHSVQYYSSVTVTSSLQHHSSVPSAEMTNEITITSELPPLSLLLFSLFTMVLGAI